MEKVIVIGVDSDEKIFVKCLPYMNDVQLEADVFDYIGDSTFYVIYEEDLDVLEDALDNMYAPIKSIKKGRKKWKLSIKYTKMFIIRGF